MCTGLQSKPQAAFSLVEVMVALAVFTLVIAGAFVAINRGYDLVTESRHYTRASQVIQSEIELLRTLPWDTFSGLDAATLENLFDQQIESQFGAGTYDGAIVIRSLGTNFIGIDVSVTWSDIRGKDKVVTYRTEFTKEGVNDYYIN